LDIDTFVTVMDNSNSKKEGVSRTYQKDDGYTPIADYLGNEGWCLGLELRPGKQHTMKESNAFSGTGTAPRSGPDRTTDPAARGQRLRQPGAPGPARTAAAGLC
jgi:hypothetical protein